MLINLERSLPFLSQVEFVSANILQSWSTVSKCPTFAIYRNRKRAENALWGVDDSVFGNGTRTRKHFTFSGNRLRALRAKTAVWFSSLAPPPAIPLDSSKRVTSTHNRPFIKASFGSRFGKSQIAPRPECACGRERHTPSQPAPLIHPPDSAAGPEAQPRKGTLWALVWILSSEGSALCCHQHTQKMSID